MRRALRQFGINDASFRVATITETKGALQVGGRLWDRLFVEARRGVDRMRKSPIPKINREIRYSDPSVYVIVSNTKVTVGLSRRGISSWSLKQQVAI